ncbi:MAG TPA: PA14 domain-containing protein, partial [Chthoniobacterales bacterium]
MALEGGDSGSSAGAGVLLNGLGHSVVWTDFLVQPAFRDASLAFPELEAETVAGFYFDTGGCLRVYDGATGQWRRLPESPRPVNLLPVNAGAWARVTVRLNYGTQRWSIWLNGVPAASDLGFAHPKTYFDRFGMASASRALLDGIRIGAETPAGLVEAIADTEPPGIPAGPRATPMSESAVRIEWAASQDNVSVKSYRVYRDGVLFAETAGLSYVDATAAPGASYTYSVSAVDEWGLESARSPEVAGAAAVLRRSGLGLRGTYFSRLFLTGLGVEGIEGPVDFALARDVAPMPGVNHDRFSARWTGLVEPALTGTYAFQVTADDGVRLWVDGRLVVDLWRYGAAETATEEITLEAGKMSTIVLEYFDYIFDAKASLKWKPPGATAFAVIPAESLYARPLGVPGAAGGAPLPPEGLQAVETKDNAIRLAWKPSAAGAPAAAYRVLREGEEIARTFTPVWHDAELNPATPYHYTVRAENFDGTLSAESEPLTASTGAGMLPEPWRHRDIGEPKTAGKTEWANGSFTIEGAGRSLYDAAPGGDPDQLQLAYRKMSGDFMITARVDSFEAAPPQTSYEVTRPGARAGVMIRGATEGHDAFFATSVGEDGVQPAWFARAEANAAASKDLAQPSFAAPCWVRVIRTENALIGAYSEDGVRWQTLLSKNVPMEEEVYAGLFVSANHPTEPARAVFSEVTVSSAVELGGLTGGGDSDGDGITDWQELNIFHTDPTVADIWIAGAVAAFFGSQGTGVLGSWAVEGNALVSQTVKASVEYEVTVTEAGIHRIEAEVAAGPNATSNPIFPVSLWIDGQLLEEFAVYLSDGNSALLQAATPWLQPGVHTIRLHYDNTRSYRALKVLG